MRPMTSIAMLAAVIVCLTVSIPIQAADGSFSLADAVKDFNARAAKDKTGKDQPPLTVAEVVAAIRGWIRDQTPSATDDVYRAFQKVAMTKQLSEGARLSYCTGWLGYNGYDFDVWWVDLTLPTGARTAYTFRIRARMINSRPAASR